MENQGRKLQRPTTLYMANPRLTFWLLLPMLLTLSLHTPGISGKNFKSLGDIVMNPRGNVETETTLKCHKREYKFHVSKPHTTETGEVLECFDYVTVDSCWGRCDSYEIADWNMPYHESHHPVCTYKGKVPRIVELKKCDPNHPDPSYQVFDALACECLECNKADTSCEHLNG